MKIRHRKQCVISVAILLLCVLSVIVMPSISQVYAENIQDAPEIIVPTPKPKPEPRYEPDPNPAPQPRQWTATEQKAEGDRLYDASEYSSALEWYRQAADRGYAPAQYRLGTMYQEGKGTKKDLSAAAWQYLLAAKQGLPESQVALGFCAGNGWGVPANLSESLRWFRLAAEQGDAAGQYWLGWMYENGRGTYVDLTTAKSWYAKAAAQGQNDAKVRMQKFNSVSQTSPWEKVYVQGGTFKMGDNFGDGYSYEKPVHTVAVRSFYMGRYEVTFNEYDAFCDATGRSKRSDQGWGRNQRPVINVSWYDAVEYCNWRSKQEGLTAAYSGWSCDFTANGYRLPTEAEWEYAAKGGSRSSGYKYSGSNNVDSVAWYGSWFWDDNSKQWVDKHGGNSSNMTHVVGQKSSNEIGLYDMSGNVYEWCYDWYGSYQNGYADNPVGAYTGSYRVFRGGCWSFDASYVRSAGRNGNTPGNSYGNIGFRLVRTP